MIELLNVSRTYKVGRVRKCIFENLSFRFPKGRNVAIMGRNGAGKSTLLRMIAGLEPPNSGRIKLSSSVSWPLGFKAGFNGSMTGAENARFVSRIYGQDTESVIDYVKDFAELGPSFELPIATYSSGMKARLAFGMSMAISFDYYLIDETTAVGDRDFQRKCKNTFQEKLEHSLIVMASHSQSTIKSYCDCGLFLSDCGVYFYDDVDELITDYKKSFDH